MPRCLVGVTTQATQSVRPHSSLKMRAPQDHAMEGSTTHRGGAGTAASRLTQLVVFGNVIRRESYILVGVPRSMRFYPWCAAVGVFQLPIQ